MLSNHPKVVEVYKECQEALWQQVMYVQYKANPASGLHSLSQVLQLFFDASLGKHPWGHPTTKVHRVRSRYTVALGGMMQCMVVVMVCLAQEGPEVPCTVNFSGGITMSENDRIW